MCAWNQGLANISRMNWIRTWYNRRTSWKLEQQLLIL